MKHNSVALLRSIPPVRRALSSLSIMVALLTALAAFGTSLNTSWTYQGQLRRSGAAYTGTCNFQFSLWDAVSGGTQQGSTQTISTVNVANGLFTVVLDFGDQFKGDARWLGTSVQCSGDSGFTALDPRQPITAAPYALSLRPGALIEGSSDFGAMLSGNNSGAGFGINASGYIGLYGSTTAAGGSGVYGQGGAAANSAGVFGLNTNSAAVWGRSTGVGSAIFGENTSTGFAGRFVGPVNVAGALTVTNTSSGGTGVDGRSSTGVYGQTTSNNGIGVDGDGRSVTNGTGVRGKGPTGVYGETSISNGSGVSGFGAGTGSAGVFGLTSAGTGVWGRSTGSGSTAIFGENTFGGLAGAFTGSVLVQGNLTVSGNVSKFSGSFRIDHPLDPEHKFLSHSFVESPDMMNIYNGNVTTDATGSATVTLPPYFAALNRDYRYQLTVLGQFAQAIVSREIIADNTFAIRTDKPGIKVSWQVTGIRQDAYAKENPIVVEQAKSGEEDGKYLYPAGFGAGEEKRIGHSNGPAPGPVAPVRSDAAQKDQAEGN